MFENMDFADSVISINLALDKFLNIFSVKGVQY